MLRFSIALLLSATAALGLDLATLGAQLSPLASIITPSASNWTALTSRWDPYSTPTLVASVQAAIPADVAAAVRFATRHRLPLLVTNTAHGFTRTIQDNVHGGLQISVRALDSIAIDVHANTATIGGGVRNYELVEALFKAKKRTATGGCDCVGIAGLALGGGHGKGQGLYGLVSDNLLSADVVLADGSTLTVSATQHADLFWALRGAGHSFGVVTRMVLQLHDVHDADVWTDATYLYPPAQLAAVVALVNRLRATQHAALTLFTGFARDSADPALPPRVRVSAQFGGSPAAFAQAAGLALEALGPAAPAVVRELPWNTLAAATGIGLGKGFCEHAAKRRAHYSVQLSRLDAGAVERALALYAALADTPFANTSVVYESYPLQAVQAAPAAGSAYPHRAHGILAMVMVNYAADGAGLDEAAGKLGRRAREVLQSGAEEGGRRVYVNYAQGDEDPAELYWPGGEEWRRRMLVRLKGRYDPGNVFRAYNPVVQTA
ncbi:hypothetical protein EDC01DRAFT_346459 [Geopyxis carbonaria]|nr:hypothetical protein EDC01DRAFT_346459 [Geopyxis carbonaria]